MAPAQKPGGGCGPGSQNQPPGLSPRALSGPARSPGPAGLLRARGMLSRGSGWPQPRALTGRPRGDPRSPRRAPPQLSSLSPRRALWPGPETPAGAPRRSPVLARAPRPRGPLGIIVPAPPADAPSAPRGLGAHYSSRRAVRRDPRGEVAGAQTAAGAAGRGARVGDASRRPPACRGATEGAAPRAPGPPRQRPAGRGLLHRP